MITLSDSNSKKVYENAFFPYNEVSKALTLNKTDNFSYLEKGANNAVPSFVMNGTISVIRSPSSQKQIGTVGAYMIPAIMLDKYTSEFAKRGFTVDSHFTYKDLRGGQKGTGPEQTLIIWTTPESNLDKVISALKDITPTLRIVEKKSVDCEPWVLSLIEGRQMDDIRELRKLMMNNFFGKLESSG